METTTPATYYAGEGVAAYQELFRRFQGVLLGWLAYRAGRNHYDISHDLGDSIVKGAEALRRWWIWIFFTKVWLFTLGITLWINYVQNHKIRGESFQDFGGGLDTWMSHSWWLLPFTFVLGVVIPFCRNVDFSLFRRRFYYRLFQPLTIALNFVPVWMLYGAVIYGLFHW